MKLALAGSVTVTVTIVGVVVAAVGAVQVTGVVCVTSVGVPVENCQWKLFDPPVPVKITVLPVRTGIMGNIGVKIPKGTVVTLTVLVKPPPVAVTTIGPPAAPVVGFDWSSLGATPVVESVLTVVLPDTMSPNVVLSTLKVTAFTTAVTMLS